MLLSNRGGFRPYNNQEDFRKWKMTFIRMAGTTDDCLDTILQKASEQLYDIESED